VTRKIAYLLPLLLAGCHAGEVFVAGYGGPNIPSNEDALVLLPAPFPDSMVPLNTEGGATGGGRLGAWFSTGTAFEPGVALDVSHSSFDLDAGVPFEATAISFLAMARLGLLRSEARPHGLLQPYVALGPSIYLAEAAIPLLGLEDSDRTIALDFRAGLQVEAARFPAGAISLFAEYRLTRAVPEFNQGLIQVEVEALTHYALFGVALSFGR